MMNEKERVVLPAFARGNWGFGSDLDLVAVVASSAAPFEERRRGWLVDNLPVPVDLAVYTIEGWTRLSAQDTRFARLLRNEVRWLVDRQ